MADFVTLSCPTCGGKLQITPGLDRFACAHCGNEHVVRRGGGIVSLAPVVEGLDRVRIGVDKTASELAIRRLQEEIPVLQHRREEEIGSLQRRREEEVAVLQSSRTKEIAGLKRQRPFQPKQPEVNGIVAPFGLIVCLFSLYALISAFKTANLLMGLVGAGLLVGPAWAFWSSSQNDKRKAAEYTANLEGYNRQCVEFDGQLEAQTTSIDGQITARIAELDVEITTKTGEFDAEIATKTAELDEHIRTVRIK